MCHLFPCRGPEILYEIHKYRKRQRKPEVDEIEDSNVRKRDFEKGIFPVNAHQMRENVSL